MTHARDWLTRNVRVAIGLPCSALLMLTAPAHAAGAEGGVKLGLGGGAQSGDTTTAGGAGGHRPSAQAPLVQADEPSPSYRELIGDHGNPANYEFAFVSVAAYQAWGLAGRTLFFGAGGGLGPPLYRYSSLGGREPGWDPSLEVVYGNLFLRVSPVPYVDIDVGPKIAILSTLYDANDPPQSGFSYVGYADLRVGSRDIKFGPRFEYGRVAYHDYHEAGWRLTPLMVRVVH
jgi:hypothetical protein